MMKIVKIKENVTRSFAGGEEVESIDNVSFEIRDDNDVRVGEFNAYGGGYSISMNGTSTSVEESIKQVRRLFNIED